MDDSKPSPRLLVITPAKDEAQYIGRTIASMVAQKHRPALWIIVDDGSQDQTEAIATRAAEAHSWIRVIRRDGSRQRRVGPGVVEAFYEGLNSVDINQYDYICKLDADLEFQPEYFQELLARFERNPRLGTASGKCFLKIGDKLVAERSGDDFSCGAAKLYRRCCFQEIGGFVRAVMWDGIDCHRCRMLGWQAVSFHDAELRFIHMRQMGSSHLSVYHGRFRWGRGQYFMGTHPLYALGIGAYRMLERPWVIGGFCILAGYFHSLVLREPRYEDPSFRRHLHGWQRRRLASLMLPRIHRRPRTVPATG